MKKKAPLSLKKIIIAALSLFILIGVKASGGRSDSDIRDNVVMLRNAQGMQCSGIQVKAPSGKPYILSAGHCKPIADADGQITVITEDHKTIKRHVIAEDMWSDLLLIEGLPTRDALSIASSTRRFAEVRTFTHGAGHDTYQTKGVIVDDHLSQAMMSFIENEKERAACTASPKNKVYTIIFGDVCVLSVLETTATATIVPGSSGGALVDSRGDLVGIASMTDGNFGYFVRLKDVKQFLQGY